MSVRLKFIFSIISAIALVTVANLGVSLLFTQQNLEKSTVADLEAIAQVADEYVSSEIELLKADVTGTARYLNTLPADEAAGALDEQTGLYDSFLGMAIVDRSGTVAKSAAYADAEGFLSSETMQRAFAGEEVISTTYYDKNGKLVFYVSTPMAEDRVLTAAVPGNFFSDLLSPIRVWETGNIFIVDAEGYTLASVRSERVQERNNFILAAQQDSELEGVAAYMSTMIKGESTIGYYSLDGQKRLSLSTPVTGSKVGWTLGVSAPLNESPSTQLSYGLLLSQLVFFLVGAIAAIFISKRIARPVEEKYRLNEELAELKAKAEHASEAKTAFLANMSHEMRTPLNAIIGLSDLQLLEEHDKATQTDLMKIHSAGTTLLSIINDILDISKIESGKFDIIPVDYAVPSLINDTVAMSMMRIGSKPIKFSLQIDESLPTTLHGDELRVKQIFNNLLSNAFKYTREGTVTWDIGYEWCTIDAHDGVLGTARSGEGICLVASVSDTGIGIKPEDIGKLFGDYNQVDVASNRSIEGTGLGLAITRRLVETMGGSIEVQSVYGEGSVFTVRIPQGFVSSVPLGKTTVTNLQRFQYVESKHDTRSSFINIPLPYARVLLVDDNQTNLAVARGMMKRYGMQIDCVDNGQAAVERVRDGWHRYNAIFMDHMMPGMDGIETFEQIRALGTEYAQSVPIIALTANAVTGNVEMFEGKGFAAFLAKPLDFLELDAVIRQWVRDKEYEKSIEQESEDFAARSVAEEASVPHSAAVQGATKAFGNEGVIEDVTEGVARGVTRDVARGVAEGVIVRDTAAQGVDSVEGTAARGAAAALAPMALLKDAGINVDCGLERFSGCAEEYLRILALYLAETTAALDRVRELGESEKQLAEYAIVVHGIKGSSRGVGAEELAETAEQLEKAAKAGDWGFVILHNEAFLDQAQILLGRMEKTFGTFMFEEVEKPSKNGPDDTVLERLYEAASNFSIDDVEDALEELEDYEYQCEGDLVIWLRQQYDRLAFDEIAVRLSDYVSVRRGEIDEYQAAS
jgi:signal transduction histidine kinase/FixJ family two-component response regulator/HPt (histidine-containing phosphotransfer) domain-containing protein